MEKPLLDEIILLDAGALIILDWKYELLEICPRKLGVGIHIPKLVLKEYRPPKEKAEYVEAYSKVYLEEVKAIENGDSRVVDFFEEVWDQIGRSPIRPTRNRGEAWALALGIRLLEQGLCSRIVFITGENPHSKERFAAIAEKVGCSEGQFIVEEVGYLLNLIE